MPQGNSRHPWRPAAKQSMWPAGDPRQRQIRSAFSGGSVLHLPTVLTIGANGITNTAANLVGAVNPNGTETSWWVAYGTSLPLSLTAGVTPTPPVEQITNIVPNGSFEYDATGGAPAGYYPSGAITTFQVQSGWASPNHGGAHSLRITSDLSGGEGASFVIGSTYVPTLGTSFKGWSVSPGQQYVVSSDFNVLTPVAIVAGGLCYLEIRFYTSIGGFISATSTPNVAGTPSVTLQNASVVTVPASAAYMVVLVVSGGSATTAIDFFADEVLVTQASSLPLLYFDGDTIGYEWSGTAGDSPSAPNPSYGLFANATPVGSGTIPVTVTYELTGLETNETYYYAFVGQSAAGTVYGAVDSFVAQQATVTTAPVSPYGQPLVTIPHFNAPFSLVTSGTQSGAVVVEQDTLEEIVANVNVIAECGIGQCAQLPSFGIRPETFLQAPPDTTELVASIQQWEPRATEDAIVQLMADGQTWGIGLLTSSAATRDS